MKNYWAMRCKNGLIEVSTKHPNGVWSFSSGADKDVCTNLLPKIVEQAIRKALKGKRGDKAICKISVDDFRPLDQQAL